MATPEVLPPTIEVRDLTPKYATLTAVGIAVPVRATADAEFFDEHPESSELWSPGSPIFPVVEAQDGYTPVVKHLRDLLEMVDRHR